MKHPLFVAVDTTDLDRALFLGRLCTTAGVGVKLGLEFFSAQGGQGVAQVQKAGAPVLLDLKFHDIPNTVRAACREVARLGVFALTLHVAGGPAMLAAAREGVREGNPGQPPLLLGVTVLTSLSSADLHLTGCLNTPKAQVRQLAGLADDSKLDGIVCSAHEVEATRAALPGLKLLVPGIRPAWAGVDDQQRVMAPAAALAAGADWLVIGRPITGDAYPAAALQRVLVEMGG